MRLRGLIRKEFIQIVRDPSSIAIAFVLPLVLLLIFGYGVSLDAKNVPVGIVIEQPSPQTSAFRASFEQSPYFEPHLFVHIQEAEAALRRADINGIVWVREDFSEQILSGATAPIGVFVNGVDANTARLVQGYVQGAWTTWLLDYARSQGRALTFPVKLDERVWFNPGLRSRDYLVPGLIAVIMTLIGALLTALVVAREWERGTMEALMVTPVTIREILLGKLIPYFVLGLGGLLFSVSMAVWVFEVPLRGSLGVLLAASALFLLAVTGLSRGAAGSFRAFSPGRPRDGTPDLDPRQRSVRRLAGGPARHLSAGLHPLRFHLRYRQHADLHPGSHAPHRRPLLRGHPPDRIPGR